MTFIWGHRRPHRKCTSEGLFGFLSPPETSHDKTPANPPAVEPLITKYTEEDLQRILRTIFEARAPLSDGTHEKPLKAKSLDVYFGKSYMECYNFCQQYEDQFATAGVKGPNRILFATSFLRDRINFC